MCTPWTMSKFIRWRVRDWASCFLACRFPLDDHEMGDKIHISSPQLSIRNMAFCVKDDIIDNNIIGEETNEKLPRKIRSCKKKRRVKNHHASTVPAINPNDITNNNFSVVEISHGSDHQSSSWPHFHEEDYIVFCFGEDGHDFDVVKECKSETSSECYENTTADRTTPPRPVNRKLHFVEVVETIRKSTSERRSNGHGHGHDDTCIKKEEEIIAAKEEEMELRTQKNRRPPKALGGQSDANCIQQEGKEEEGSNLDPKTPSSDRTRLERTEELENSSGIASAESSESNKSNGSTGSFTFPALRWELTGSPVQMPKAAEDLHARSGNDNTKERVSCARFHYCWRLR